MLRGAGQADADALLLEPCPGDMGSRCWSADLLGEPRLLAASSVCLGQGWS